jgi:hypothetical protein
MLCSDNPPSATTTRFRDESISRGLIEKIVADANQPNARAINKVAILNPPRMFFIDLPRFCGSCLIFR